MVYRFFVRGGERRSKKGLSEEEQEKSLNPIMSR